MRSSILSGLLLLCILIPLGAIANPSDTLIIDGKKVIVNRVIEYDTVSVREYRDPSEIPKPKRGIDWLLGVEGSALVALSAIKSDLNNLQTVDEFSDTPNRISLGPGFLFYGGFPLGNSWSVYSGVGMSSVQAPFHSFDMSQLHDSLYRFESFDDGELSQIVRYDFGDLGAELDTLPMQLSGEVMNLQYVEIPLLFQFSQSLRKKPVWRYDFEFGVNVMFLIKESTSKMMVINENGSYEEVPVSGQHFSSTLFGVRGAGGLSRKISKDLYAYGRLLFKMPLNSPTEPVSRIQAEYFQMGIQLGVRYIFRP